MQFTTKSPKKAIASSNLQMVHGHHQFDMSSTDHEHDDNHQDSHMTQSLNECKLSSGPDPDLEHEAFLLSEKSAKDNIRNRLLLWVSLVFLGNFLFFFPEKKCSYSNEEDCLKYFIEPNLKVWLVSFFGSVFCFFYQTYFFLLKGGMKRVSLCEKKNQSKKRIELNKYFEDSHVFEGDQSHMEDVQGQQQQHQPHYLFNDVKILRMKKYWRLLGGLGLLNQFLIQIFASPYIDPMDYHGAFRLGFTTMLLSIWLVYFVIFACKAMFTKFGKKCLIISLIIFSILIAVFYQRKLKKSCDRWLDGVYESVDTDNEKLCQIQMPTYCWSTAIDGMYDFSRFSDDCEKRSYEPNPKIYERFFKNYHNDYPFVGYPDTTKFDQEMRRATSIEGYVIQRNILSQATFYKDLDSAKAAKHEVIVDIQSQKVIYNIQRKEERVQEVLKIQQQQQEQSQESMNNSNRIAKNIVVIFIDAVSRRGAHRFLPKSLEQLSKTKENFYEFFRYHAIRKSTAENLLQFFYNKKHPAAYPEDFKDGELVPMVFEKIKNQGYITSSSSDVCQTKSLQFGGEIQKRFKNTPMDHEGFALACDPNYQDPNNPFGFFQGPNSTVRRCYYQKNSFQHVFDHSLQFRETYKDVPTFQYLEFLDAHEPTGQLLKYMDDALHNYLQQIDDENTLVMLVSDHGHHMSEWTVMMPPLQYQMHMEMALPMLFVKMPPQNYMTKSQADEIKKNQQRFVTMETLHYSLQALTGVRENKENMTASLFDPIDENLDCTNSIVNLEGIWCACKNKGK